MGGVNRGVHFFNSLFPEEEVVADTEDRSQGRDVELIKKRNERMVNRMVWYKTMCPKWDYREYKKALSEEFEISVARIEDILAEDEQIRLMVRLTRELPYDKDERKYNALLKKYCADLKKKWYWMDWEKLRV